MNVFKEIIENKEKRFANFGAFAVLGKDFLSYLIGIVMLGLANFVLVPLYTRYLTPTEFGAYALADITANSLVTVTQLGLGVAYLKWFAEAEQTERGRLLVSILTAGGITAGIGGGLIVILVSIFRIQIEGIDFIWLMWPIIVLENLQGLLTTDLRASRRPVAFAFSAFVRLTATVVCSLWFIVIQKQGLVGVFWGRLLGDILSVASLIMLCMNAKDWRPSLRLMMAMISYGFPLTWVSLLSMFIDASGRYFLLYYSTIEQVGIYSAAVKISSIFQMLIYQPFGMAWGGVMFQIARLPNSRLIYSRVLLYLLVFSTSLAISMTFVSPMLFAIFATDAYASAIQIFALVLLVRVINVMEYPAAIGIYLSDKTKWFLVIYSVGFLVNILINFWLTPLFGMFGVVWAQIVSWLMIAALMIWIGQRYYPLYYSKSWFASLFLIWSALIAVNPIIIMVSEVMGWFTQITLAIVVTAGTGALIMSDLQTIQKEAR